MSENERCYTRIKRGMVFWYNIDPSVDKFNVPEIKVSEKKSYRDYLEYGERPWLLISVDEKNIQGRTCTILPLCTNDYEKEKKDKFHVSIKFKGKDALILCEHLMTVNCSELIKYDCTLENHVMERVESVLRSYLGISAEDPFKGMVSDEVVARLEDIIGGIIKKKVEEERRRAKEAVDVDDAVLRISEGLESLFDVFVDKKEIVKKEEVKEVKEPEVKIVEVEEAPVVIEEKPISNKTKKSIKKSGTRGPIKRATSKVQRRWDRPSAISFIQEVQIKGADVVSREYDYADAKSVQKMVKYLEGKYNI